MSDDLVKRLRDTNDGWASDEALAAADRIEELEAKLEAAVDALKGVQDFVCDLTPYAEQGHTLVPALRDACTTLAKIKEEADE